jgi:hypothetical protein
MTRIYYVLHNSQKSKDFMHYRFLIVGTVSNVENSLKEDYLQVHKALSKVGDVDTFLVESDSQDSSVNLLSSMGLQIANFQFVSLGNLNTHLENRVERIRFCRNKYVEFVRQNQSIGKWDYIVVADFDGMNSGISSRKIVRSLGSSNLWDACFATQTFGHYDLFALRAKGWVEHNVFDELEKLKIANPFTRKTKIDFINFLHAFRHYDRLRQIAIYSKMKRLNSGLVNVDSAFGGFAIYKPSIFEEFDYERVASNATSGSEHLDLHHKCKDHGLKLVIDSQLTNAHWNEYNLNKLKAVRFLRELRKYVFK